MKIVMLTGSPHNPGTSKQLADAFEAGAKEAGHSVYRYDAGLQGTDQPHFLQLEKASGMEVGIPDNDPVENDVLPHLLKADVVVLVSSLYYFGINAQLKAVIDRFCDYNHELKGKKSVVLVTGYGSQDDLGAIKLQLQKLQKYMRWPSLGDIYADDSWNQRKLAVYVQQAHDLGQSIK
ncbi:flavodoxin family protein [Levilactobacillus suantsaii]|uniref:Flavodoxin family protein n=1 Tax=Levilactobacillus suantsaii TaxID=2292255 RepID=A0A4Q0VJA3_9LACO|nr:flavodoxin family protein [Levilactobacillus suantsaii]QMU08299.1 flavodoxin family protein [Levilactobacillus suantsaii]RXI78761.1 flavodoxin family protein [Levilactobacillus suantsaii]